MNQALLAKSAWKMSKDAQGLWAKIYEGKYLKGRDLLSYKVVATSSATWKGICQRAELVRKGVCQRVGNRSNVDFWLDEWSG